MAATTAPLNAAPAAQAAVRIGALRRQLAALEPAVAGECGVLLALGNPLIDGALGGGLGSSALHEIAAARETDVAAAGNALGLILYTASDDVPSAAVTRWIVGAAAPRDSERSHGIGPPRFLARLVRNRRGPLGTWIVEWNSVEQRFELATHSEPVAGAAFDRPHRTAVA